MLYSPEPSLGVGVVLLADGVLGAAGAERELARDPAQRLALVRGVADLGAVVLAVPPAAGRVAPTK